MARRRNPKKDKSARRRRPNWRQVPGGRARISVETVTQLMLAAPPDALPLVGMAGVWLWNVAQDAPSAAYCVDGCLTLHYALAEYGIDSRVEAVILEANGNGARTLYGGDGPHWNPDGTFNGHTVLVVPAAGRFLDATLRQYAEVPNTEHAALLLGPLIDGEGLGSAPLPMHRRDHLVVYHPVPDGQRDAWRGPPLIAHDAAYRRAGANLAANVIDMLRQEYLRDKTLASPYPRLRRLVRALDGAKSVADDHGYRFGLPGSRKEVRLADFP
ncbi:hypothetical protein OHA25_60995 (plasmid) [Nonomuraea sp. NBC_00507]|uniref:hypothetical protein n=1 Tax=Nonomuraea sp. NBC_00507 TaxID=2976002 RepID=UPI002E16EE70